MVVSLKYGDSDYEVIKQQLIEIIPQITEKWTDFNDSDVGITLVDLMARLNDFSAYRRDKIVNEVLLPRAVQRKNVKDLLKLVGYKMHSYVSSVCDATLTLNQSWIKNITIPAYTQISLKALSDTDDSLFSNLSPVTIYAGSLTATTFKMTQGEVKSYQYTLKDIKSGVIVLPDTDVGDGTILVEVQSNSSADSAKVVWGEVDDIAQVITPGNFFSHEVDQDGNDYISFHAVYATSITNNSVINIKYLISKGADGKAAAGSVVTFVDKVFDSDGTEVTSILNVTNSASVGGDDPETIDHAKLYGPIKAKTMDTLVSLEDYRNYTAMYPSIAKALALDWNYEESGLTTGYLMNIYVALKDGSVMNETFKAGLKDYLMSFNRLSALKFVIYDATYMDYDLNVKVYVSNKSLYKERAQSAAQSVIAALFSPDNLGFGVPIYYTALISKLQFADPEIIRVEFTGITGDIVPDSLLKFIRLISSTVTLVEV